MPDQLEGRVKEDHFIYHQDRSSKAEQWPQGQGKSNPVSELEWKKSDREHRSGAQATPQKPSRHDLQPTDDQERDEQRNSGSYAESLKWPPPFVGNPRNVQTSPVVERYLIL
jgi:hypothetical protein